MVKFKIEAVLWHEKLKTGNVYPVYIKIYFTGQKVKYHATGIAVPKEFWDKAARQVKSAYPDAALYNDDLQKKLSEIRHKVVGDQYQNKQVTAASVKTHLSKGNQTNIFNFADKYIDDIRGKRAKNTISNYEKHLRKLEEYHGTKELHFEQITDDYLDRYENYLRQNVGNNYTYKLIGTLRTFFSAARRKKLITCYPFEEEYEMPVYVAPDKEVLTIAELATWEIKIDEEPNREIKQAAVWFLFGCYTGLRISDWYLFDMAKNVETNHIRLRAKKNKEFISVPISKPLARVLSLAQANPLTVAEATVNEKIKVFAKRCKIHKHLTAHCARHTFAVTICLGNRVSSETAAELMGITLQTFVDNYSQVTDEKINRETAEAWANLK